MKQWVLRKISTKWLIYQESGNNETPLKRWESSWTTLSHWGVKIRWNLPSIRCNARQRKYRSNEKELEQSIETRSSTLLEELHWFIVNEMDRSLSSESSEWFYDSQRSTLGDAVSGNIFANQCNCSPIFKASVTIILIDGISNLKMNWLVAFNHIDRVYMSLKSLRCN